MKKYFTKTETVLWCSSVLLIVIPYFWFGGDILNLVASFVGVTSLIFCAKGNPIGQALMIVFSLIYGIISFEFKYYGEMLTYIGMTMPMAVAALVSWLRHPYKGNRAQVKVGNIGAAEAVLIVPMAAAVTAIFYFILKRFGTANLLPSTLSVTTSFVAVYLTFRRSPYFALAYAANDIVLVVLWTMASISDMRYASVTACFLAFLANDVYGFISWQRMKRRQSAT